MVRRVYVRAHSRGSKGAKMLLESLKARLNCHRGWVRSLDDETTRNMRRQDSLVVDWGYGGMSKLDFFQLLSTLPEFLQGVDYPNFTTNKATAVGWARQGEAVMCRTLLNASSGDGIVVALTPEQVVDAPLYTRYLKKKYEYRVHLYDNRLFWQQKKRRRDAPEDRNPFIRNLDNGYVFSSNVEVLPAKVVALGEKLRNAWVKGAFDIVYNERHDTAWVLEVNAAPGLCEVTAGWYADLIAQKEGN